jgi:hypothetical protein
MHASWKGWRIGTARKGMSGGRGRDALGQNALRAPPLGDAVAARVVALTLTELPGQTTHWTVAAMATTCATSASSRCPTIC